ncbi:MULTISPECIES: substrate-binding domain-containing protein [unclassified Crossiella]|uniref:molybdate ABC transporter substrate-binding protein n=1 Tax=unclassified Crossiella TaxID=2620835 RepID=UPI001FFFA7D5|nr:MULTISPECIES: substrate-binding domain-containing protein [unclassified Crossiella]MCK2244466.1 substrate-binding domain-containing protein [Crossiella sp. S99.2]MCK2258097.1 substrate-binding domain-containing protein [Crossiella sp. S99.1]
MTDRPTVSLFSALSVRTALDDVLLPAFTEHSGADVETSYDPTTVLVQRITDGARPELVIAITEAFPALAELGAIDPATRTALARSGIGLAVPADADAPDLSTVDALCTGLTSARSVAYSRTGASGIHFAALIEQLGIAEQVNARATVLPKGFTAEALLDGRADLAVQQLSELAAVPGVRIAGPLPDEVQQHSELSLALAPNAGSTAAALALFLTRPRATAAFAAAGLLPV